MPVHEFLYINAFYPQQSLLVGYLWVPDHRKGQNDMVSLVVVKTGTQVAAELLKSEHCIVPKQYVPVRFPYVSALKLSCLHSTFTEFKGIQILAALLFSKHFLWQY